ncbi:MAG: ABC transporter ATP-binding protein [Halanaerobiaceae bacterium]|nr:ABC transporter ATP-binding protein [Halanaerobiaceae bacterium]
MKKETVIEMRDLSRKYKSKVAVKDISFEVKRGEIFGLLGPNGAGKTTTINLLLGLQKPDQGYCRIFGNDSRKIRGEIYRKLGVVFEEKNLYIRLNGFQNLKFFADLYDVKHDIIYQLLDEYELLDAASRQVKTYSKGMKQRLLICRALLNDPELLILDEPTDGLDPVSLRIIHNSLLGLKKKGKTILLCTHYMEEAERLCDRLAIINKGALIALDTPGNLKKSLGEEILEIRIEPAEEANITVIKNILDSGDMVYDEKNKTILLPLNSPGIGRKIDIIKEWADIISIHSREASLSDIFLKLTEC